MIKKLSLLPLLFCFSCTNAQQLRDYGQIQSAIQSGKLIRIAVDFAKCSTTQDRVSPSGFFGVYTPNEIIIDQRGRIIASFMHFTMNDQHFPNKAVYQFAKYTITENNNLTLTLETLDALNYLPLAKQTSYHCPINVAAKVFIEK